MNRHLLPGGEPCYQLHYARVLHYIIPHFLLISIYRRHEMHNIHADIHFHTSYTKNHIQYFQYHLQRLYIYMEPPFCDVDNGDNLYNYCIGEHPSNVGYFREHNRGGLFLSSVVVSSSLFPLITSPKNKLVGFGILLMLPIFEFVRKNPIRAM